MSLADEIKAAEVITEEVTNTTTPEASAGVLIDWFTSLFRQIAGAGSNAAVVAGEHADAVEAHKTQLAAAVAANP